MMLIGTYILIGVAIVGVGMFTVMQVDEYFYKRKRYREIQDRHDERMHTMAVRNAEFMMRMGMNSPDGMIHTLCSPSRHGVQTQMLHSNLGLTSMPPPAVYTPEEFRKSLTDNPITAIPAPEVFKRSPILMQPLDPKLFMVEDDND